MQGFVRVPDGWEGVGGATVGADEGGQQVRVGVADLHGAGRVGHADKFVAGGEDGDDGLRPDVQGGSADRGGKCDLSGAEAGAGGEQKVAGVGFSGAWDDVFAGAQGLAGVGGDGGGGDGNVLQHADGVCALRHGCAGHDLDGLTGLEGGASPLFAGTDGADEAERRASLFAADRVAVAGGAIERWLIAVGVERMGEHAAQRIVERDLLCRAGGGGGAGVAGNGFEGFCTGKQAWADGVYRCVRHLASIARSGRASLRVAEVGSTGGPGEFAQGWVQPHEICKTTCFRACFQDDERRI